MKRLLLGGIAAGLALAAGQASAAGLDKIKHLIVIYAENRSFDNLYSDVTGAEAATPGNWKSFPKQLDRDGKTVLPHLPQTWGGVTGSGVVPAVPSTATQAFPNLPFHVDDPKGLNLSREIETRDLWHRFYQNQMQINGGANNMFVAWADSGALVMGQYTQQPRATLLPVRALASQFTLADHFFQGAFGGSFLNHQYLVCSCAPVYPNAASSVAAGKIAVVNPDGVSLTSATTSPASALDGPPTFVNDGALTPPDANNVVYGVNTMQPPYQPSAVKPAVGGDPAYADPTNAGVMPPQTLDNIGDYLSNAGVSWAWYAGAWGEALAGVVSTSGPESDPNFQYHHQPFNYFATYAPGTAARAAHLLDGGEKGANFIAAIDAGTLPAVTFYKPQGNLNEHAGYTDITSGDQHLADIVDHVKASSMWPDTLIVITYDEFGGWWDHVAPPKADRFGPGTRIPAILIGPEVKHHFIDHTQYDTTSILRFITRRWKLPTLPGIAMRDAAMVAANSGTIGDLTNALTLKP